MIDPLISAHYTGDCRELLKQLPDACVQTCITSPPYFALRDYGVDGQIGLEATPDEYIASLVDVFREVRRVLRDDGTLWLNLGDSYSHGGCGARDAERWPKQARSAHMPTPWDTARVHAKKNTGLKPKDLIGIPWMAAFALRADGWYLRSDIVWNKPNPMPESVTDRPTKSHEYIFLLSKSATYFYNADAIREPLAAKTLTTFAAKRPTTFAAKRPGKGNDALGKVASDNWARDVPDRKPKLDENGDHAGANKRSVWTVTTKPFAGAHLATYPPALIEPCVLAGSRVGDLVLDPFFGSGTTGEVAEKYGRRWIGLDLNPAYAELQKERTAQRSLPGAAL